jgi:hypothetical protein
MSPSSARFLHRDKNRVVEGKMITKEKRRRITTKV